jgi:hypothetical protein
MSNQPGQRVRRHGDPMTLIFGGLVVLCLWQTTELSRPSAMIPRLVLITTLLVLLVQWVTQRRKRLQPPLVARTDASVAAISWVCALPAACWLLGIPIGAGLHCLLWLRWHGKERWPVSVLYALVLGLALQLVFGFALQADLYRGVWAGYLS